MRRPSLLFTITITALSGCVPTELTPEGHRVRTGKAPPHAGCQELGIVMGSGGGGGYTGSEYKMENAQNELRNRTAEQGGDFVVYDASGSDLHGVTLSGRAFDCSRSAPASAPVPVVIQASGGETPPPPPPPSIEERLQKLEDLHQKGLITDDERAKRRAEILGTI